MPTAGTFAGVRIDCFRLRRGGVALDHDHLMSFGGLSLVGFVSDLIVVRERAVVTNSRLQDRRDSESRLTMLSSESACRVDRKSALSVRITSVR